MIMDETLSLCVNLPGLQSKRAACPQSGHEPIELSHLHLGRDGWEVIVHGRNAERGAEVVHAIEAGGGQARFVAANLSDVDEVRALVKQGGVSRTPAGSLKKSNFACQRRKPRRARRLPFETPQSPGA